MTDPDYLETVRRMEAVCDKYETLVRDLMGKVEAYEKEILYFENLYSELHERITKLE